MHSKNSFEHLSEDQKLSKLCADAGLKLVEREQYFLTLETEEEGQQMEHFCREYTLPRNEEGPVWEDGFEARQESVQSWT